MTQQHWRDRLPVHPAAELFPLMSEGELRELAADIKKNGLRERVKYDYDEERQVHYLLDGRNRLDALELLDRDLFPGKEDNPGDRNYPEWFEGDGKIFEQAYCDDPVAHVISANIHRRHLTSDQKRELIAKLLKLDPEKSDRAIAATVKVDNKTVAKERREMESREDIPHVARRTDTKGRNQPARKNKDKQHTLADFKAGVDKGIGAIEICIGTSSRELSAEDMRQARDYVIARLDAVIAALDGETAPRCVRNGAAP
jgi:hypothetical protein